jgi:hypothetical protein
VQWAGGFVQVNGNESVAPVKQSIVSNENQCDVVTFAKKLRDRFGLGVKLTFHVESGRTQGREPSWWNIHENGDGV